MSFNPVSIGQQLEELATESSKFLFENDSFLTKRIALQDIPVFGSNVVLVYSEADLPPVTNGFHQLDPLTSYKFMKQGITIAEPILLPAGYIGHVENMFSDNNGVIFVKSGSNYLFNTLFLDGAISQVVNSGESGKITITSNAHGILDGQYVNITGSTDTDYNGDRKQVSNVTTNTFDVIGTFVADDTTGIFDTGYQSFQMRNFLTVSFDTDNQVMNIQSNKDDNTNITMLNCAYFGYDGMGTIDNPFNMFANGCLFSLITKTFTLNNPFGVSLSNSRFKSFFTNPVPALTISGTENAFAKIINTGFSMIGNTQNAIRVEPTIGVDSSIKVINCDDTGVLDDFFDLTSSGLDERDPRIESDGNGVRKNSMTICEGRGAATFIVTNSGAQTGIFNDPPQNGDYIQDPSTERFSVDQFDGEITYNGLKPITAQVAYHLDAAAGSGTAQNIDFRLTINDTVQTKATRSGSFPTGSLPVSFVGNFSLNPGDRIQLLMENLTNSVDTHISNMLLLVNLG